MEISDQTLSEVILFWSQFDNRPWSEISVQERHKIAMIYLTKAALENVEITQLNTINSK